MNISVKCFYCKEPNELDDCNQDLVKTGPIWFKCKKCARTNQAELWRPAPQVTSWPHKIEQYRDKFGVKYADHHTNLLRENGVGGMDVEKLLHNWENENGQA